MSILFAIALLVTPEAAPSQYLYSCRAYTGETHIQDQPCPPTMRETRRIAVDAHVPTASSIAARQRVIDQAEALSVAGLFGKTTVVQGRNPWDVRPRNAAGVDMCAWMKSARDNHLKQIGLARTYGILSGWNTAVYDACKPK